MFFWPWGRLSSIGEWVDHEKSLLHAQQNLKLIFCLKILSMKGEVRFLIVSISLKKILLLFEACWKIAR